MGACVGACVLWLGWWRFAYDEDGAVDDAVHPRGDADVGELGEVVARPLEVHLYTRNGVVFFECV